MAAARQALFERRLKQLEREARRVRADIRLLSKALEKPDRLASLPRPRSLHTGTQTVPPPQREDPAARPEPAKPSEASGATAAPQGELFAWRPPVPAGDLRRKEPEPPAPQPVRAGQPTPKAGHLLQDDRFAAYFSSGRFFGTPPARADGRVHRNKAVFMVIVVAVFGFILYKLLF